MSVGRYRDAVELVGELAYSGESIEAIQDELRRNGLDSVLREQELEAKYFEARAAKRMIPKHESKVLPRIIGVISILLGCCGIWLTVGSEISSSRSPGGLGFFSVIVGLVLLIKPDWSKANVD